MARRKSGSQGEILDELRKIRAQVGREFRANPKRFEEKTRKLAKELGLKIGTPLDRKRKVVAK